MRRSCCVMTLPSKNFLLWGPGDGHSQDRVQAVESGDRFCFAHWDPLASTLLRVLPWAFGAGPGLQNNTWIGALGSHRSTHPTAFDVRSGCSFRRFPAVVVSMCLAGVRNRRVSSRLPSARPFTYCLSSRAMSCVNVLRMTASVAWISLLLSSVSLFLLDSEPGSRPARVCKL